MKNLIKVLVLSLAFAAPMAISAPGVQAETAHTQPTGSHVKKGSPTATATPTATPAAKPKKPKKSKNPKATPTTPPTTPPTTTPSKPKK